MDRLLKTSDVMGITGCKADKARSIMLRMKHLDLSVNGQRSNLRVWESDLMDWIDNQMQKPALPEKTVRKPRNGPRHIPYRKVG